MKKIKIPWRAWYGDKDYKLTFPEEWDVSMVPPCAYRVALEGLSVAGPVWCAGALRPS